MKQEVFIVAHRGLSGLFPENTMPSFEHALALPVNAIEFDLYPTRDGKIVIAHDSKLGRCCNGSGMIYEKTLDELKQLDFGAWKGSEFVGTRIPEFHELLDFVDQVRPEIFLCVEIKHNDPVYAKTVLNELKRRNRLHNCSIISSHSEMLRLAYDFEPGMETHGFEPDESLPEEEKKRYFSTLRRIGINKKKVTAEKVEKYHSMGIRVDVWDPDTPEEFNAMVSLGVDFITTNRADVITRAAGRIK